MTAQFCAAGNQQIHSRQSKHSQNTVMLTLPNADDQHESCVLIVFAPRVKLTVLSKTCMQRCAREEDCNSFWGG